MVINVPQKVECLADRNFLESLCGFVLIFVLSYRLDVYIYDYLVKRNLQASAKAFLNEGKVSSDPVGMLSTLPSVVVMVAAILNANIAVHRLLVNNCCFGVAAIDAPGGFLFEWWSVFWDIFIARTNEKHSEVAASYIEVRFPCQLGALRRTGNGFAIFWNFQSWR